MAIINERSSMQRVKIFILFIFLQFFFVANNYAQRTASYLQMGRYELSQRHFTKAIEYLNAALEQEPESYFAFFYRGLAKESLGDYTGAEQDYSKAILIFPVHADVFMERAVTRDKLFNFNGAFEDYSKAIALDSTDANIYFNRAVTLLSLNQFEAAIADCNHAEKLKLNNEELYIIRGAAKAGLTSYNNAIADFNKVLSKNPKNTLALVQRGIVFSDLSKKDSALIDFNAVFKIDSSNIDALLNHAMVYMNDSKTDVAMKDLNHIIRLSPEYTAAYFNRAIIYGNSKKYKESIIDYDKVLELNPQNILAYFNRAIVKSEYKDFKGALKDYDKVIALYPTFADAYYNRSLLKKEMNNISGSKEDYKKALEIKQQNIAINDSVKFTRGVQLMKLVAENAPDEIKKDSLANTQNNKIDILLHPLFSIALLPVSKNYKVYASGNKQHYQNNAITLVNNKDSVDVSKVQEEIIELGKSIDKNPKDASNYLDRAILFSSIKNYNESFSDYDKAIELNPNNPMAWFSRANTRFKLLELMHSFDIAKPEEQTDTKTKIPKVQSDQTYQMVIKDYNMTLALDPNFTYAWFNNANTKIVTGDYQGAIDDLSKAIAIDPTLADAYFNRGLLLISLNYIDLACKDISKAGELGIMKAYNVIKKYCK